MTAKARIPNPATQVATNMPTVLAFVHNTESDARLILDIAESRLLQRHSHEEEWSG